MLRGDQHKKMDRERLANVQQIRLDKKSQLQLDSDEKVRSIMDSRMSDNIHSCVFCFHPFATAARLDRHVRGGGLDRTVCQAKEEKRQVARTGKEKSTPRPIKDLIHDEAFAVSSARTWSMVASDSDSTISEAWSKWLLWINQAAAMRKLREQYLEHGWAIRPPAQGGGARRTPAQIEFLTGCFDCPGYKMKENEARAEMNFFFNQMADTEAYSKRFLLSEKQIKSWFSSEKRRRCLKALNNLAQKLQTELQSELAVEGSCDLQQAGDSVSDDAEKAPDVGDVSGQEMQVDVNQSVVSESGKPNLVSYIYFSFVVCVFVVGAVFFLFCACERGCCGFVCVLYRVVC